jgi:hypothetical protein
MFSGGEIFKKTKQNKRTNELYFKYFHYLNIDYIQVFEENKVNVPF